MTGRSVRVCETSKFQITFDRIRIAALVVISTVLTALAACVLPGLQPVARAAGPGESDISCKCDEVACKPCEEQVDITFYTSKCGPKNQRVKSCKRPSCKPVENQTQCLAELSAKSGSTDSAGATRGDSDDGSQQGHAQTQAPGAPNAHPVRNGDKKSADAVGIVTDAAAPAKLIRVSGTEENAQRDLAVYEGDVVETGVGGKARVTFKDQNILNVTSESRVEIQAQQADFKSGKRKTLLNLLYGKVRSKVNKINHYDGVKNSFEVRTRSAVAGVRGTDFVTSFSPGEKIWESKIETLEGRVEFGGDGMEQKLIVDSGKSATFSIDAPVTKDITNDDLRSLIIKGRLSEPRRMNDLEQETLRRSTDFKGVSDSAAKEAEAKKIAAAESPVSDAVCSNPAGNLHACAFTCEGEKRGDHNRRQKNGGSCPTDRPGVHCVRRICNANGQWAEPTNLPKSAASWCDSKLPTVRKDCGEY